MNVSPYVNCKSCSGTGNVIVLGGNKDKCRGCAGLGYMLRDFDEIIETPAQKIENTIVQKKKRGRKPKQLDIVQVAGI